MVANFILRVHEARREEITQLRLYKLLYFSHGWYLAEHEQPLVWNYFEAWENGPVIKVVRDCFSKFGKSPITEYCSMFDLRAGKYLVLPSTLMSLDEHFIEGVIDAYKKYSSRQLSLLTHTTGSSWDLVWNSKRPVGRFGLRLTNDEILREFQDIVDK